ncbi:NAD(P)/FAD-dependent oxidoreductase [Haladaptatus sp. NG-WS-4]
MTSSSHDAIVVGGGIVGAHCGLQLARAGLDDVVVLERDEPASKASGRAAGSLTIWGQERFGAEASAFCRDVYIELNAEYDELTFHPRESYSLAYSEEGAEHLRRDHESLTVETELLTPEELADRRPEFAVEDVYAAVRFPHSRYTDPKQLTLTVHQAAADAGVTLHHEGVESLVPGAGTDDVGVETTVGRREAPVVVVAAGAWSKRLLATAGVDIALRPRTSQIVILEPANDIEIPSWEARDYNVYGRPTPEGRILFGGGVSTPIGDLEGFDTRAFVPFLREVGEYAPYVFPALEAATLHDDWAGRVSATPDLQPHIGETTHEGLYVCAGFNGEGISNSPFGARLVTDLVFERDPIVDPEPFRPGRHAGKEEFRIGNAVEWT